ncbi:MAG TPA: hypothetical protein VFO39_21325 [Candidatus Sulfotelmatobacter sp.]|nr:hypothetical protein [Candidatus Sulfotelmatobacter sp.]
MDVVPQYAGFLAEFKREARWLLWRNEARNGGRPTKVPYCARGGRASSTDQKTWCSYEDAVAAVERYDGLGFAIGDGTVLIDLDGCRDPETGIIDGWALEIISVLNAPTEVSPSMTGVHIYIRSRNAPTLKRMFGTCERKRGIEIYAQRPLLHDHVQPSRGYSV